MRTRLMPGLWLLLTFTTALLAAETVPPAFNYQGRLTDETGHPLISGEYTLAFRLWDDPTSTSLADPNHLIWGRERAVTVVGGGFNIILDDSGAPVPNAAVPNVAEAFQGPSRYLGLTVIRTPAGTVPAAQREEIVPRQQILTAPFALEAERARLAHALSQEVMDLLAPPGTVVAWMGTGTNPPPGWAFCHGQLVPKAGKYARLFAAIGTGPWPDENGDQFKLPDLRGMFLRGVNAGATTDGVKPNDPDVASRLIYDPARDRDPAAKEWTPGSVQGDAFRNHTHDLANVQRQIYHTGGPPLAGGAGYWHEHGDAPRVLATGGSETRPKNVYVHYLIKL